MRQKVLISSNQVKPETYMKTDFQNNTAHPNEKTESISQEKKDSKGFLDISLSSALCSTRILLSLIVLSALGVLIIGGIGIGYSGLVWYGTQPSLTLSIFMVIVLSSLIILILSALLALNAFEADDSLQLSYWIEICLFFSLIIVVLSIYGGIYIMNIDQSSSIAQTCINSYSKIWPESLLHASETAAANLCTASCPCDYTTVSNLSNPFSGVFSSSGAKNATGCNLGISTSDATKLKEIETNWNCAGVCQISKIYLFSDVNNGLPNQNESCFAIASQKLNPLRNYFFKGEMVIGIIQIIIFIIILCFKKSISASLRKDNLNCSIQDLNISKSNQSKFSQFEVSKDQKPKEQRLQNSSCLSKLDSQMIIENVKSTISGNSQKKNLGNHDISHDFSNLRDQNPDSFLNAPCYYENSILMSQNGIKKNEQEYSINDLKKQKEDLEPDLQMQIQPDQECQSSIKTPDQGSTTEQKFKQMKNVQNNFENIQEDTKNAKSLISGEFQNLNQDDFNLIKFKENQYSEQRENPFIKNEKDKSIRLSHIQSQKKQLYSSIEDPHDILVVEPSNKFPSSKNDYKILNSSNSSKLGNKLEGEGTFDSFKQMIFARKQSQGSRTNSIKRIFDPTQPESSLQCKSDLLYLEQPQLASRNSIINNSQIPDIQTTKSSKYLIASSIIQRESNENTNKLLYNTASQILQTHKPLSNCVQDSSRGASVNSKQEQHPLSSSRPLVSQIKIESQFDSSKQKNDVAVGSKRFFRQTNNRSDKNDF